MDINQKFMTDLITVPTFTFTQGDVFDGRETPIQVLYWNQGDLIELRQEGNNGILINTDCIKKLTKLIIHHLPEATNKLKS